MTEHRRRLAELLAGAEDPPRPSDEIGKLAGILTQRNDNRRNRADYHTNRSSAPGDYFDARIAATPQDQAFNPAPVTPDLQSFLMQHPWLAGIQDHVRNESGQTVSKAELLGDMLDSGDYDYAGAYKEMGPDMFALDPASNTYHGFSRAPSGRWLKSPNHETAWKEIFMQEAGFTPDTPYDSPHASLTRGQASDFLLRGRRK